MKAAVFVLMACFALPACMSRQADPGVPTLDGSSRETLRASLAAMTEGMARNEQEGIGLTVALMVGSMICEPGKPPPTEKELADAYDDILDELDGMTLEDIRAWDFDDAARERAAACGSWH